MIIEYQGRQYDFDQDAITVDEWRELKRKYKMTPKGWQDGINEADPDAMTFLWWVLARAAGQPGLTLGDHLKPDVIALNNALGTAVEEEERREAAQAKAELETAAAQAATELGPTQLAVAASPAPPSQTGTTPPPPGQLAAAGSSTGSLTGTSTSFAPSTSSSSAASVVSEPPRLGP
jgi:hypothetical protein